MKERIPLRISDGRLILHAVIECKHLRIHKQQIEFVIDTGSSNSFLSNKEVIKLQIPVSGRGSEGEIDFGGSRFQQINLPKFDLYMLKEDNQKNNLIKTTVSLYALKTTKSSEKKIQIAYSLPSILGTDFLKEQKFSLHVFMTENLAYLDCES